MIIFHLFFFFSKLNNYFFSFLCKVLRCSKFIFYDERFIREENVENENSGKKSEQCCMRVGYSKEKNKLGGTISHCDFQTNKNIKVNTRNLLMAIIFSVKFGMFRIYGTKSYPSQKKINKILTFTVLKYYSKLYELNFHSFYWLHNKAFAYSNIKVVYWMQVIFISHGIFATPFVFFPLFWNFNRNIMCFWCETNSIE